MIWVITALALGLGLFGCEKNAISPGVFASQGEKIPSGVEFNDA
jgi:hypothetical protein